jgi:hypothetical protein
MHIITFIKIFHLFGLIMGFGGALLLDLTIFTRGILRPISAYAIHQTEVLSRVVTWGLVILWATGIALIWMNTLDKPEYITNQKLWAKVAIVILLTVNGVLIHHKILPYLKAGLGQRLFDGMKRTTLAGFTLAGSISFVSWVTPFILGKASELNYVTPMWEILAVYLAAVMLVWASMFALMSGLTWIQNAVRKIAAATVRPSDHWENLGVNLELNDRHMNLFDHQEPARRMVLPTAPRRNQYPQVA